VKLNLPIRVDECRLNWFSIHEEEHESSDACFFSIILVLYRSTVLLFAGALVAR
jgi:hypothetical protein